MASDVPGTELPTCAVAALAHAARDRADAFDAAHRGRRLRGVRRDLGAGRRAWYVRDVTGGTRAAAVGGPRQAREN